MHLWVQFRFRYLGLFSMAWSVSYSSFCALQIGRMHSVVAEEWLLVAVMASPLVLGRSIIQVKAQHLSPDCSNVIFKLPVKPWMCSLCLTVSAAHTKAAHRMVWLPERSMGRRAHTVGCCRRALALCWSCILASIILYPGRLIPGRSTIIYPGRLVPDRSCLWLLLESWVGTA